MAALLSARGRGALGADFGFDGQEIHRLEDVDEALLPELGRAAVKDLTT